MRQLRARTPPIPPKPSRAGARGGALREKPRGSRGPLHPSPISRRPDTYQPDGRWCAHLVPGGVRLRLRPSRDGH